jgi:hypothetical protein
MQAAPAICLSALRRTTSLWWPEGAVFGLDFLAHRYMKSGAACAQGDAFSVTRGSSRLAENAMGHWQEFANDIPARTDLGLSISDAAVSGIRNSTMSGAVAGTPGSLPTLWGFSTGGGIGNCQIVGTGTVLGLPYVDVRIAGATTSASGVALRFDTHGIMAAGQGDDVTFSAFMALVGGSITGFGNIRTRIIEHRADTTTANTHYPASIRDAFSPGLDRFVVAREMAHAETASARVDLEMSFASGEMLDMTLRIAAPQLEAGIAASAPILSSGTPGTRQADVLTLHLPPGSHDLVLSFADAAPQTFEGASGDMVLVRDDLNGGTIISAIAVPA